MRKTNKNTGNVFSKPMQNDDWSLEVAKNVNNTKVEFKSSPSKAT